MVLAADGGSSGVWIDNTGKDLEIGGISSQIGVTGTGDIVLYTGTIPTGFNSRGIPSGPAGVSWDGWLPGNPAFDPDRDRFKIHPVVL